MDTGSALSGLFFCGSVHDGLARAREITETVLRTSGEDCSLLLGIEQLRACAADVNQQMEDMRLGRLCIACSSSSSGGCCSLYMAGETDAVQISMNMLAGIDVQVVCEDGRECLFLGERGCIFLFKPMFCLNYLCDHIRIGSLSSELARLEELTGRLLRKQYEIEQQIVRRCRQS